MIGKCAVINGCVIGSCQLNVLVSPLVIAALLLSTQDKAAFRLKGVKRWPCLA